MVLCSGYILVADIFDVEPSVRVEDACWNLFRAALRAPLLFHCRGERRGARDVVPSGDKQPAMEIVGRRNG